MLLKKLFAITILILLSTSHGQPLDTLPHVNSNISDTQLRQFLQHSAEWLTMKSTELGDEALQHYVEQLHHVLHPACLRCTDYFQAVAVVRGMGKAIRKLLQQDTNDNFYPAIRRSFVAAVWLLQRSKMFVWNSSHLDSSMLGTMLRLYLHHVKRAQGRTISFHHVSKCGGTTMCQLAATNRCSNPHLTLEKNCVLDDRQDGPVWMVSHKVNETGAFPDNKTGVLDVAASHPIDQAHYNRHEYATEPQLSMWLMYACPYQLNGMVYTCQSRKLAVRNSGTTFIAVERTLSPVGAASVADLHRPAAEFNRVQVCPDFINAVTLREPVPHAVSLLAEVRFRYLRQLQQKNITTWEPSAWNLTWWETLGPALVGSYATRTLIGRGSFCRSAANMSSKELHQAVDALLGFDMVMTLDRAKDIDLLVSTLLGWPARRFSSQPAKRVRTVAQATPVPLGMPVRRLMADGSTETLDSTEGGGGKVQQSSLATAIHELQALWTSSPSTPSTWAMPANNSSNNRVADRVEASIGSTSNLRYDDSSGTGTGSVSSSSTTAAAAGEQVEEEQDRNIPDPADDQEQDRDIPDPEDAEFEEAAMQFNMPFDEAPPPILAPEVLEAQTAARLVRSSWLDRQSQLLGYYNITAALAAKVPISEPRIESLQERSKHGAHLILVRYKGTKEVWHAFPRHGFAFREVDIQRLAALTKIDAQLFSIADLMLDLDSAWLHALLQHPHHRRKLTSVYHTTYTACGFAGILPQTEQAQKLLHV